MIFNLNNLEETREPMLINSEFRDRDKPNPDKMTRLATFMMLYLGGIYLQFKDSEVPD